MKLYTPVLKAAEDPLNNLAQSKFQIPYIYPFQRLVIANILEGVSQLVIFPTASGKSLCFQLPALLLKNVTLVILPLLSLLNDQVRSLKDKGLDVGIIKGGQKRSERDYLYKAVNRGQIKLIYCTPEAFISPWVIKHISRFFIQHMVLDEAHCIYEWGKSFRPAYLKLVKVIQKLKIPVITAATATASELVISQIKELLFDNRPFNIIKGAVDRPNIYYGVIPVLSKKHAIVKLIRAYSQPMVFFCRSRTGAELFARLARQYLPKQDIFFYHAGLNRQERKKVEQWFFSAQKGILFSTSAYGMGVDKADIRTIVHIDVPPSVESYLQESGRGGRDDRPVKAVLLYSSEDESFYNTLQDNLIKKRYLQILTYARLNNKCRREQLFSLMDARVDYCSGCDFCNNNIQYQPPGKNEIISFIKRYSGRFTRRELIKILSGESSYELKIKGNDTIINKNTLQSWNGENIEEALERLIDQNIINIPARGIRKHKVIIKKSNLVP